MEVEVHVSNENKILAEWKEGDCSDLPALINTVGNTKQTVNEVLTDLVKKKEGNYSKTDKNEWIIDDIEDEAVMEDTLTEIVKEVRNIYDENNSLLEKNNEVKINQAKRFKK